MKVSRHAASSGVASALGTLVGVLVACGLLTAHAWAASGCKPLFLLMEGGSGNNAGAAMQDLANELRSISHQRGIFVDTPDNDEFWRGKGIQDPAVDKKVSSIKGGGYDPLVIVGHSRGGALGFRLANDLPTTLLVTLDPISYARPDARPRSVQRWVHVYVKGNLLGPIYPEWGYQLYADRNIHLDLGHNDVRGMYAVIAREVEAALRCRPTSRRDMRRFDERGR